MSKKLITKLIVWGIFIALVVTAVILLVTVVNKTEETPIFEMQGSTLLKYNGDDEKVEIPNDVESVGKSAFEGNDKVTEITFEKGSKVKTISKSAFKDCKQLESIDLPDTVTSIGAEAFKNCTALYGIDLPSSVTEIGYEAFYGCIEFTGVALNEGLLSLGEDVFEECINLARLSLPKSLVEIGPNAFYNCPKLTLIECNSNPNYFVENKILYHNTSANKKEIVLSLDTSITSIVISDVAVERICENAFYRNSKVTKIVVPNTVTEIENGAFSGCTAVTDVELPFIGNTLDSTSGFKTVFNEATTNIVNIKINQGTKVIEGAFKNLKAVKKIELPNTIKVVASSAFEECSFLEVITNLPTNLERIYSSTFKGCKELKADIILSLINDNLKVIDKLAFANCQQLTEITIPDNVISLGAGVFNGCSKLKSISLPYIGTGYTFEVNSNKEIIKKDFNEKTTFGYIFNEDETSTSNSALFSLKEVEIRGNYNLPDAAFSGSSNIEKLTLCEEIQKIGNEAFSGCSSLKEINLPTSLISLGSSAFQGSKSLTKVELPSGITELKDSTFKDCSSLKEIDITYVSKLGKYVFYSVNVELTITIDTTINQNYQVIDKSLYTSDDENGRCDLIYYLPKVKNEDSFEVNDKVKVIKEGAFVTCSSLNTLVIPTSVETIETGALSNCTKIKNLTIPFIGNTKDNASASFKDIFARDVPKNVNVELLQGKEINNLAFQGCTTLISVKLPNTVEIIGEAAFSGCTSLKTIELKDTILEKIGKEAFLNCSSLTALDLPSTVKTIGDYAFADCKKVSQVNIPASLENLGVGVFRDWESLTKFESNSENYVVQEVKGSTTDSVLVSKDGKTLILYMPSNKATSYQTPDSIKKIESYAFSGVSTLQEVRFTKEVEEIGEGIFSNCKKLVSVYLPSNLPKISYSMFENCTKLVNVLTTTGDKLENIETIEGRAFYNCASLVNHVISDKVKEISESAFEGCTSIVEVILPSGMEMVSPNTFKGCTSLEKVVFNENIKVIGDNAFEECKKLLYINLVEGLEEIGPSAFLGCAQKATDTNGNVLRSTLRIPTTVKVIGSKAFQSCISLSKIYIPSEVDEKGNVLSTPTVESEAFSSMASAKIYSEAIGVVYDEDGAETDKTYPDNWATDFAKMSGTIYGFEQFELGEDGMPKSEDAVEEETPVTRRDTKPGQCDYKEDLGYYFMITAALLSAAILLRKRQNH